MRDFLFMTWAFGLGVAVVIPQTFEGGLFLHIVTGFAAGLLTARPL